MTREEEIEIVHGGKKLVVILVTEFSFEAGLVLGKKEYPRNTLKHLIAN